MGFSEQVKDARQLDCIKERIQQATKNLIERINMSLKELPVTHFKVAVEELNHRYKVCLALASLVEEIVELGSSTGKSLSKVSS